MKRQWTPLAILPHPGNTNRVIPNSRMRVVVVRFDLLDDDDKVLISHTTNDKAEGDGIYGNRVSTAYIDSIAPNVFTELEAELAAFASIEAAIAKGDPTPVVLPPAPDAELIAAKVAARTAVQLAANLKALETKDAAVEAAYQVEIDAARAVVEAYIKLHPDKVKEI